MNTAPILEHFEGALLRVEEGFRESPERFIEREARLCFYCVAQRSRGGTNPAFEERALHGEVALLHGDEVAHRVAKRRDMVFRLAHAVPAREPQCRKLAAETGERRFARVTDGISACVQCDGRLAGADEHSVVLVA